MGGILIFPTSTQGGGGGVYTGTTDRITVTGSTIDIASTYVGQSSITTVGTLTGGATGAGFTVALTTSTITGLLVGANGGTGVANTGKTITLGGNLVTTGAFNLTLAVPRTTTYTLPDTASETLAGLNTAQTFNANQTISGTFTLTVGSDQDVTTILGRARIHSVTSDSVFFAHFDLSTNANFALRQTAPGATTLNAPTGQTVTIAINGTSQIAISTSVVNISSGKNVTMGGAVGAPGATNSFSMGNGTIPSGSITDGVVLYPADIVAGNSSLHVRSENGDVIKIYSIGGWGTPTATLTRTTFDPATVTLPQLAERVAALITDLLTKGELKA